MHWPCALFRAQPGLTQRASPPLRSLLLTSLRCPITVLPKSSISLYILQTDRQTDMCDPLSLCSPTSSWHRPFFLPDLPHLHCFLAMSLPGLCHTDLIVFSPQFSNEPTPMCPLKHQLPPPHSSISSKKKKAPTPDSNTLPLVLCSVCPGSLGQPLSTEEPSKANLSARGALWS